MSESLRVRFVKGLASTAGATAIALVWDPGSVVVDEAKRGKRSLDYILWHESLHHRYVAANGMTWRAGIRNMALDTANRLLFSIDGLIWVLLGRPKVPWVEVAG